MATDLLWAQRSQPTRTSIWCLSPDEELGREVARAAADESSSHSGTGGKSANIVRRTSLTLLRQLPAALPMFWQQRNGIAVRMLVPATRMAETVEVGKVAAAKATVGDPQDEHPLGPVVSEMQYTKIQGHSSGALKKELT